MQRVKNKKQKRQMMALMICLLFLLSTIVGAVLANNLSLEEISTLQYHVDELFHNEQTTKNFINVFLKYLKYDVLIWLGGCFYYGAILSAGVLAFRGISLGYTAAILFRTYKAKAILVVICTMLPQNMVLLPVYFFMTFLAFCFLLEQKNGQSGKGALKREITRVWTEYAILLCASVIAVAVACFVEMYLSGLFLNMLSGMM